MAVYKVPQDVEADDKLIGPFSFRQFIYLIIVAIAIATGWVLGRLFLPLSITVLPVVVFFGALALPLRKDQPMETYMAAMLSFYLKPRKRLWDPDGIDSLIEITAPKTIEYNLTKDIDQAEASRRLSYLADIVDSQGWAVRGPGVVAPNSAMNDDVYNEAQKTEDIQDSNSLTAQSLKFKLDQSDAQHHQDLVNIMSHKRTFDDLVKDKQPIVDKTLNNNQQTIPIYNPYPDEIKQSVIEPTYNTHVIERRPNIEPIKSSLNTSNNLATADIISLASNTDLSIESIAKEANRIKKKQGEVYIPLR